MSDITRKSIAVLIDELVTTAIKKHYRELGPVKTDDVRLLAERKLKLGAAIDERVRLGGNAKLSALLAELVDTLLACWHAQEAVMSGGSDTSVADAAKDAQRLNAKRNNLLQAIDRHFGDEAITVTGKTYDR